MIDYINKLLSQETPPTAAISLSSDYEKAYLEDDLQRTKVIQLNGDHRNYITVNVPANVHLPIMTATAHLRQVELSGSMVELNSILLHRKQ